MLAGKLLGPIGIPRRLWEDTIRIDLKEIVVITKNPVGSAQNGE